MVVSVGPYADGPVTVRVPATSANLGPGFDALGLALGLHDELTGEVTGSGLEVVVRGAGEGVVPLDERHLVVASVRAAFTVLGVDPPGLRLECRNVIPHGRGLGSSSAAIVGGLALARALVRDPATLDDQRLLELADSIEGHPDNVAPALLGGFTIAGRGAHGAYAVGSAVSHGLGVVVLVPPDPVGTAIARGLLPASVPHADAAAGAGRAALLVAAMAGRPELLWEATRDWLHQEQRRPAMPASLALVDELRADGVPAVVSGAGPTVLAFTGPPHPSETDPLLARCPDGWVAHHLSVDHDGVQVVPDGR